MGTATKYFKVVRGIRQGDPISAYIFLLLYIYHANENINGLHIFEKKFLYIAYADTLHFS